MTNQTIQQSKANYREKTIGSLISGITSMILGIVSIIPIIILFTKKFLSGKIFFLSYFSIAGIVFGLLGLKRLKFPKKIIAILGIIFSTIGLIGLITFLFIALGIYLEG